MIIEKRIPFGYILSKIIRDLIIAMVFSSFAFVITRFVLNFTLPATIAAFLGTAISLLISFKLAQSYDRWWEARKVWGAIVNDSRTLVLQLLNLHTGAKS
jgi:ion channel-forming bestrophin family protein